jgi:D-glycero-D-manno-heptose 1,7-bisphosphate phosphatase
VVHAKGKRRAVFLDRDGVINEIVWRDGQVTSPRAAAEFVWTPGLTTCLPRLKAAGYVLLVITNQPEIPRGLVDPGVVEGFTRLVLDTLPIDDLRQCSHDNEHDCPCRKPKPGMILDHAAKWNVDLESSFLIGDTWRDMEAGRAAGVTTVLIHRPYNRDAGADFEVDGVPEAVELILKGAGGDR